MVRTGIALPKDQAVPMTATRLGWPLLLAVSVLAVGTSVFADTGSAPPAPADDVVINANRASYDTSPAMCVLPDGTSWTVWRAYLRGKERVLARHIGSGSQPELGPIIELSDHPGVVDSPHIVAGEGAVWAFWSSRDGNRWRIVGRPRIGGRWRPTQTISAAETDSIRPQAVVRKNGDVVVSWCGYQSGPSCVWARVWNGRQWGEILTVSDGTHQALRPVLAEWSDQAWVVWDEYVGTDYVVKARPVVPERGPIEQVSPKEDTGRRCLTPVVLASAKHGLCVAWLKLTDVIGGEGVIDQLHTLQMAVRRAGQWELVRDENDDGEAAYLVSGLLTDIRDPRGYPMGYMGRRRHPLLVQSDETVWLLWEQKADHRGSGLKTTGDLLGRSFREGRWQPTVRVCQGLLEYRIAQPARIHEGRFLVHGSQIPGNWTRTYHRVSVDLAKAEPFVCERWDDAFQPVQLPLDQEVPRHPITIEGKTYQLYWGDLHCHGGYTPDAEGEPDEILNYGRDRGKLDVVVLEDNDEIYHCFLTESQYGLDVLHSQRVTEPGRFLALQGYEWTQRVAKPGVAFNPFVPVYDQPGAFPNHRTVIYPATGGPIVRYPEVGGSFKQLCDQVEKAGGILQTQHHVFVPTGRQCEANMEVCSGWGIYIHRAPQHFHGALDAGYRLGFIGCGDSHRRNPGLCSGLTGIYAESLETDAILDALRKHRCFATNGSKIILDARANGRPAGEDVTAVSGRATLALTAIGTRPIVSATLIRGGEKIESFPGNGTKTLEVTFEATELPQGTHWYYWEVAQEGASKRYHGNTGVAQGHLAWSSPHWVVCQ